MKKILIVVLLLLSPSLAFADGWKGDVNFALGGRSLDSAHWASPYDSQYMLDIKIDFAPESWPVSFLVGRSASAKSATCTSGGYSYTCTAAISETYAGAITYFEVTPHFSPYVAAGVSAVKAELSVASGAVQVSASDNSVGFFVNGGVLWKIGHFNIGVDGRVLTGTTIKIGSATGNANYAQLGVLLGFNW